MRNLHTIAITAGLAMVVRSADALAVDTMDCCKDQTAQCLACGKGLSVDDYCRSNPKTDGCAVTSVVKAFGQVEEVVFDSDQSVTVTFREYQRNTFRQSRRKGTLPDEGLDDNDSEYPPTQMQAKFRGDILVAKLRGHAHGADYAVVGRESTDSMLKADFHGRIKKIRIRRRDDDDRRRDDEADWDCDETCASSIYSEAECEACKEDRDGDLYCIINSDAGGCKTTADVNVIASSFPNAADDELDPIINRVTFQERATGGNSNLRHGADLRHADRVSFFDVGAVGNIGSGTSFNGNVGSVDLRRRLRRLEVPATQENISVTERPVFRFDGAVGNIGSGTSFNGNVGPVDPRRREVPATQEKARSVTERTVFRFDGDVTVKEGKVYDYNNNVILKTLTFTGVFNNGPVIKFDDHINHADLETAKSTKATGLFVHASFSAPAGAGLYIHKDPQPSKKKRRGGSIRFASEEIRRKAGKAAGN